MSRWRLGLLALLGLLAAAGAWWLLPRGQELRRGSADVIEDQASAWPAAQLPTLADARPAARAVSVSAGNSPGPQDEPRERRRGLLLSGWLVDERYEPLIDHELRLSSVATGQASPRLEARIVSGRDGRFVFHAVSAGSKLLEVRGPGQGDLPAFERRKDEPTEHHLVQSADEGRIYFPIPEEGLHDVAVVAPRHAAFWVEGVVELEVLPGEPPKQLSITSFRGGHLDVTLTDPRVAPPSEDTEARDAPPTTAPGVELRLNHPGYQRQWRDTFIAGADSLLHTQLEVRCSGFAPATLEVEGLAPREHVGRILLERVATLAIRVLDEATEELLEEASIRVSESGGGKPDRVTTDATRWGASFFHDCDRREGSYELTVTAQGYQPWKGSGELWVAAEPQLITVDLLPAD